MTNEILKDHFIKFLINEEKANKFLKIINNNDIISEGVLNNSSTNIINKKNKEVSFMKRYIDIIIILKEPF